jgi:hypothetical protein
VVFDVLRGWLRGRTTAPAAPAASAAPDAAVAAIAPRDDDPAWRDLPVQRLTFGPPELVSDPRGFGDSLASWGNPSLQIRLGHAVSPQAPSGVVDGVVQPRPATVQRWESAVGEVPALPAGEEPPGEVPPGGLPVGRVATTGTAEEVAPAARPVESVRPVDAVAPVIVPEAAAPATPAVPGERVPPVVVPLAPQRTLTVARAVELPLRALPVRSLPPVEPVSEPREAVPVQRVEADSQPTREPEPAVVSVDEERPLVGERPVVEAVPGDSGASVAPVAMQRAQDAPEVVIPEPTAAPEGQGRSLLGEQPVLPVVAPAIPAIPAIPRVPQTAPQVPDRTPVVPEGPPTPVQRLSGDPVGGGRSAISPPPVLPPDSVAEQPEPQAVQEFVAEPSADRPLVGEQPLAPAGAPPPATPEPAPARRVGLGAPLPSRPAPVVSVQRQEQPPAPRRLGLGAPLPAVPVPPPAPAPVAPAPAPEPAGPLPVVPEIPPAAAREPAPEPLLVQRQQPLTVVRATPLQRAAQEVPLVPETEPGPVAGLVGERGLELRSAPVPTADPGPVPPPGPGAETEAGAPHAPRPIGLPVPAPPAAVPVVWAPAPPAAPTAVQRSVRPEPVVPGPVESAAIPSWAPSPVVVPLPVQRSVPSESAPPVPWEPASAPVQRVMLPEPPPGPAVPVFWDPAPVQRAAEPEPPPPPGPPPPPEPPPPQAPAAPPGQQAPAPAPAAPGESTDELVRRLVGPLSRLLRAELRLDRERAGVRLDPRH